MAWICQDIRFVYLNRAYALPCARLFWLQHDTLGRRVLSKIYSSYPQFEAFTLSQNRCRMAKTGYIYRPSQNNCINVQGAER